MAARRRLDISSLLCDSKEESPDKSQPQQVLTQVPSSDYPSSEQGAFVYSKVTSPYNSPQYEQISQYQREPQQHRQDGPYYWEKRSPESLPSAADLVPLALQATSMSRRTPSPSFLLPSQSATDRTGLLRPSRHSEGLQEATFPRSSTSPTQLQQHPHRYSQFPQPPSSTSPVNIHQSSESARERRASHQFSVRQHSSISQTHPSPSPSSTSSLPNKFSASARPLSISPTDLAHPRAPFTSGSAGKTLHLSPVLPRQLETRMNTSQRTSTSLSPTVPISGLSGLDVLVQAATEERERIDVHRRLSGGEEPQLSSNYVSSARCASLSPVVPRKRSEIFQAPPPTPPYSATPTYVAAERVEPYYNGQGIEDVKRRLPSPEPYHPRQVDNSWVPEKKPCVAPPVINKLERRSQSPGAGYERSSVRLPDAPQILSATSRHLPGSRPASLQAASSSARTIVQRAYLEDEEASTSNRFPHTLSSAESGPIPYVRRSPPRSKPKPKKPGSAALASLEKELAESHNKGSGSKQIRRLSPPRSQMQRKLPDIGSMARQSNERGASEDEDVDDFFLSAFDSPRNAARQIPSRKPVSVDIPSVHSRAGGVSLEPWHHIQPRRSSGEQQVYSPAMFRASPDRTDEYSNYPSPVRGVLDHDDEETMPDVEAEIFDEIAEAAGGTTSEAERTDFDDQATDNMEVDVENELLSLIDGPPESRSYHQAKPPFIHSPRHSGLQGLDLDRMSMPPPDTSKVSSTKVKDSKKRSTKPMLKPSKGPPDEVTKPAKGFSAQPEDSSAKPSKPKSGAKPRPTKGLPVEKAKRAKVSKEPSTPLSASLPTLSESVGSSSIPTDEAFPIVTSSGRMVTKSKKSAAASTILHNQFSLSHRKKVVPPIGGDGGPSRSRSHSVIPRASVDPETHRDKTAKEDEEKGKEKDAPALEPPDDPDKDKLYCICRTQYDEDRVMIACDRCDEWYHTQCVNMPDLLVDLVDQFICSKCIAQNPSLNLRTTYKQRCFSGLKHPDPDSPEACHKPSRGAYSKYCSDECGVRHMHRKIQSWAGNGGDIRSFWESVKDAKRREGFVTHELDRTLPKVILAEIQNNSLPRPQASVSEVKQTLGDEEGRNSIVFRLEEQLQTIVQEREELKKQLEVLSWRERLLQLASDRAESMGDCGWDQRLVYGDEEWMEFGAGVLESYDEAAPNGHSEENQDMDVDGGTVVGEWWCRGKKKCERHVGWQRVRAADMELERTTKEDALADLTIREREIRSRIEDILHPQSRPARVYVEETLKFKLSSSEGGGKKAKKKPAAA
ncbi:SPP1 [Sanghuangporus sanghuang]